MNVWARVGASGMVLSLTVPQVFDFQLSSEDMEAMLGLNRNLHYFKELE